MKLTKVQSTLVGALFAVMVVMVATQDNVNENTTFATRPAFEFKPLTRSTMLRAKAMLKWMIDNRTENGTRTFNAGFIRLIFHDCVGGCDGCVNLRNPSNAGLGFYKLPLDLMYRDFIFPWMSRADWYALAGIVAVEYAAELTPCEGKNCIKPVPELNFLYGRRECISEPNIFRFIPGPALDPRFTIRNTFRLNFAEITALMGAHGLGKNHQRDTRWVDDGTKFNNQYYKDMLSLSRDWKRGNGTQADQWTSQSTGNVMLSSDMFMAWDVSNSTSCNEDPMESCSETNTFQLVRLFAEDNEFWMREFAVAFNVMLMNGNFGRLKQPVLDTLDREWMGNPDELFPEKNKEDDYEFDFEAFGLVRPGSNTTTNSTTTTESTTAATTGATTASASATETQVETQAETQTETANTDAVVEQTQEQSTVDSATTETAATESTANTEQQTESEQQTDVERTDTVLTPEPTSNNIVSQPDEVAGDNNNEEPTGPQELLTENEVSVTDEPPVERAIIPAPREEDDESEDDEELGISVEPSDNRRHNDPSFRQALLHRFNRKLNRRREDQ